MTSAVTVTIERLGHHGDGIAEGPIFVPRTLPGEVVRGVAENGRITSPAILTPSTDRVSPSCRHYKSCGGCSLLHARDEFVSGWKTSVVSAALAANGLAAPIRRIHTSPEASRRRAVFSGRRTKSGAMVGFHQKESAVIVETPDCRVITPGISQSLPTLAELVVIGASRKGEVKLAVTDTEEGLDVVVTGGRPVDETLLSAGPALLGESTVVRLTWGNEPLFQRSQPRIDLAGIRVPLPPGAFLQATREGEAALGAAIAEATEGAAKIVDLFAGLGTFALPLARTADVMAFEGDAGLIAALDAAWRGASGLKKVQAEVRDLFRRPLLPDEFKAIDAVVIDPPRAGAAAQITEIAKAKVPRVAHVSCNPVTFARDARTLVDAGYEMAWIDVVDQFRWSSHTELVSLFEIKRS